MTFANDPRLPLRFLTDSFTINLKEQKKRCIDCEAKTALFELYDMKIDEENIVFRLEAMKYILIWILENIEWPLTDE